MNFLNENLSSDEERVIGPPIKKANSNVYSINTKSNKLLQSKQLAFTPLTTNKNSSKKVNRIISKKLSSPPNSKKSSEFLEKKNYQKSNSIPLKKNSKLKWKNFSNESSDEEEDEETTTQATTKALDENEIKSISNVSQWVQWFTGKKFSKFTDTNIISDFYEYTDECMKIIADLPRKISMKKPSKVTLKFDYPEKKLAIFDLDETLIHCTGNIENNIPHQHEVTVNWSWNKEITIGVNIRPYLNETLDFIQNNYNWVLYTASHQSYTEAVLNLIDPDKKYFKHRLYRHNCGEVKLNDDCRTNIYIKDLDIIENYNLKDMVIIDNSVLSFAYHLDNGIPIVPFYEDENDKELPKLGAYLFHLYKNKDIRKANKENICLHHYYYKAKNDLKDEKITTPEDDNEDDDDCDYYKNEWIIPEDIQCYINNDNKVTNDEIILLNNNNQEKLSFMNNLELTFLNSEESQISM